MTMVRSSTALVLMLSLLACRCSAYSSGAGSCSSAMKGHGHPKAGSGGYALHVAPTCRLHADCHKTEFCSVWGCDKCRYCRHGSDSINERCPCGLGRKAATFTGAKAEAAAAELAARQARRAKVQNGRGQPVRVRLARNRPGKITGFIIVASGARAAGDSGAGAAEGRPPPHFGEHLREEAHTMNCWGDAGLSHSTAEPKPEVGMLVYPEAGASTTHLSVVVMARCRGGSRHCEWYKFTQLLRTGEAGAAVLEPPLVKVKNTTAAAAAAAGAAAAATGKENGKGEL